MTGVDADLATLRQWTEDRVHVAAVEKVEAELSRLREQRDLLTQNLAACESGGWAATNTLRDSLTGGHSGRTATGLDALALVETALDAAEGVMTQMDYETPHHTRLAAALRAVREGTPA